MILALRHILYNLDTCINTSVFVILSLYRLVKTGFDNLGTQDVHTVDLNASGTSRDSKRSVMFMDEPRVALDSKFIVELLSGVYFAM